jgi:hypothetical protein
MADYFSYQFSGLSGQVHSVAASHTDSIIAAAVGTNIAFFNDQVSNFAACRFQGVYPHQVAIIAGRAYCSPTNQTF